MVTTRLATVLALANVLLLATPARPAAPWPARDGPEPPSDEVRLRDARPPTDDPEPPRKGARASYLDEQAKLLRRHEVLTRAASSAELAQLSLGGSTAQDRLAWLANNVRVRRASGYVAVRCVGGRPSQRGRIALAVAEAYVGLGALAVSRHKDRVAVCRNAADGYRRVEAHLRRILESMAGEVPRQAERHDARRECLLEISKAQKQVRLYERAAATPAPRPPLSVTGHWIE
jgi:hypothetical protein